MRYRHWSGSTIAVVGLLGFMAASVYAAAA